MARNVLQLEKQFTGGDCSSRAKHLMMIFHGNRADPVYLVHRIYRDANEIILCCQLLCQLSLNYQYMRGGRWCAQEKNSLSVRGTRQIIFHGNRMDSVLNSIVFTGK